MADQITITLVKALLNHCKRDGESLSEFRAEFAKLSEDDKAWFAERFTKEYQYNVQR